MKQILFYLLLCCGIVFAACDSDNLQEKKDIRLGTDNITEVSLNKLSTRTIILSGGTGKYNTRTGFETPKLEYGQKGHCGFLDPGKQGPGGHRGKMAFRG